MTLNGRVQRLEARYAPPAAPVRFGLSHWIDDDHIDVDGEVMMRAEWEVYAARPDVQIFTISFDDMREGQA